MSYLVIWSIKLLTNSQGNNASEDLTPLLSERLIYLSITDKKGMESDEFDIELDDTDGKLDLPPKGAVLSVMLGYTDTGLIDKGNFTIDEITYAGPPDKITMKGHATPINSKLGQRIEQSWHKTTLGNILSSIAGRNSLKTNIAPSIRNIVIPHIDQTSESDISFLTRLASTYNFFSTIKKDTLICQPHGNVKTSKGSALPTVTLDITDVADYSFETVEGGKYTGVRAYYHDKGKAKRTGVGAGTAAGKGDHKGKNKHLRHTYANAEEAEQAAKSELSHLNRGASKLTLNCNVGYLTAIPECPIALTNFKKGISQMRWVAKEIKHTLDGGAIKTSFECETG